MEHVDHAVKLVGADHVGLGSDFDGGGMPVGMEDCTKLPKITEALLRKGYKELVNGVQEESSGRWEPGSAKGLMHMREDFDDPIEDFAEYLP